MLVSLKWLRDYVDLPDNLDVEAFAERLTMASAEVEGIERVGGWDRELVTVAEVLTVEPHPNADRLQASRPSSTAPGEPRTVVCGAPNVAAGQRVAFAREGAQLVDPRSGEVLTLKAARIRGVESSGMVLSERELGLSEEHEGILELPADAPVGAPLADYLGDVVLDLHTWPNRADMMNMAGVAREVAAITGAALRLPDSEHAESDADVTEAAAVAIDDPDLCARYIATVIESVRVGPSPRWMQERLRAAGQRPINNVVDVTNYVMLELGNPLHAFDADRLQGAIVVRLASEGERLRTLDGEHRELSDDTLLITDDSGPIALAGVMGGLDSEVSERTTRVLLEAAQFDPASIRRTSTRLRLRSEASSRFERGLSPELAAHASRRATQLLVEVCGGTARRGAVDVYPRPQRQTRVVLERARLDTVLGFRVPDAEVESALGALGFAVAPEGGDEGRAERFIVGAPWWRTDIAIADDLAEEVVRIAGYDRLPATTVRGRVPSYELAPLPALRDRVRRTLAAAGLQEVISYSLTSRETLARVQPAALLEANAPLQLRNTLSSEHQVLRTSLRHSLLEAVDRNLRAGADEIAIFEAGRIYVPRRGADGPLPDEREIVTGALCGVERDRWGSPLDRALDFFDAKGVIEELGERLAIAFEYAPHEEHGLLAGRCARISIGAAPVGTLGEVHPDTLEAFGVSRPVALFELDLGVAARCLARAPRRGMPVPRFPAVEQDLALVGRRGRPGRRAAGVDRAVAAGRRGGASLRRLPRRAAARGQEVDRLRDPLPGARPHAHQRGREPRTGAHPPAPRPRARRGAARVGRPACVPRLTYPRTGRFCSAERSGAAAGDRGSASAQGTCGQWMSPWRSTRSRSGMWSGQRSWRPARCCACYSDSCWRAHSLFRTPSPRSRVRSRLLATRSGARRPRRRSRSRCSSPD